MVELVGPCIAVDASDCRTLGWMRYLSPCPALLALLPRAQHTGEGRSLLLEQGIQRQRMGVAISLYPHNKDTAVHFLAQVSSLTPRQDRDARRRMLSWSNGYLSGGASHLSKQRISPFLTRAFRNDPTRRHLILPTDQQTACAIPRPG